VKQFLIISSLGADKAAGNFYLKTKGEIEDFLNNLVLQVFLFETFTTSRRPKRFRMGEKIGAFFMTFSFYFGGLKNTNL
jgi:hypothetical protein